MIRVTVTKQDVLDLGRIEAGLLHLRLDDVHRVGGAVQCVEQDEARAGRHDPRAHVVEADVREIVEQLDGPFLHGRQARKSRGLARERDALRTRRRAEPLCGIGHVRAADLHRGRDVRLRVLRVGELLGGRERFCHRRAAGTSSASLILCCDW